MWRAEGCSIDSPTAACSALQGPIWDAPSGKASHALKLFPGACEQNGWRIYVVGLHCLHGFLLLSWKSGKLLELLLELLLAKVAFAQACFSRFAEPIA